MIMKELITVNILALLPKGITADGLLGTLQSIWATYIEPLMQSMFETNRNAMMTLPGELKTVLVVALVVLFIWGLVKKVTKMVLLALTIILVYMVLTSVGAI